MSQPRPESGYPRDPGAAERAPGGYGGDTAEAVLDTELGTEEEGAREGAFGETIHEPTVTQEAEPGVTTGSPSGGVAGGTPAGEVRERTGQ